MEETYKDHLTGLGLIIIHSCGGGEGELGSLFADASFAVFLNIAKQELLAKIVFELESIIILVLHRYSNRLTG